jgi:hypothetical protein
VLGISDILGRIRIPGSEPLEPDLTPFFGKGRMQINNFVCNFFSYNLRTRRHIIFSL